MCFCMQISHRAQCVFCGITIIISCCLAVIFLVYRDNYDTRNWILLLGLGVTILAAFCLITGAVLILRALLWVWIVVSLPATLLIVNAYGLILHNKWNDNVIMANAMDILLVVLYASMILISVCYTLLFLRSESDEDI